jgi:hypothetical protein
MMKGTFENCSETDLLNGELRARVLEVVDGRVRTLVHAMLRRLGVTLLVERHGQEVQDVLGVDGSHPGIDAVVHQWFCSSGRGISKTDLQLFQTFGSVFMLCSSIIFWLCKYVKNK